MKKSAAIGFGILLAVVLSAVTGVFAFAATLDLDAVVQSIASERKFNPFKVGEAAAMKHPLYPTLVALSDDYGSQVEWVPSVSGAVLALEFHEDRMVVSAQDEFNGWFDEFEVPNLIFVHSKASLVTFVHELRHALHVGVHGRTEGNAFDQALQINKRRIQKFHEKLAVSPLDANTKKRLKRLATRLLETCSEISAHHGDLVLAEAFKNEEAQSHRDFMKEYRQEFLKSYKALSRHPFSQGEDFIEDLNSSLAAAAFE